MTVTLLLLWLLSQYVIRMSIVTHIEQGAHLTKKPDPKYEPDDGTKAICIAVSAGALEESKW